MPAVSQTQQRLFAAAEHGATFPKARKLRASMPHATLHEFAATPRKGLPMRTAGHPNRHLNLGTFLHPKKKKLADTVTALRSKGAFRSAAPRGAMKR